ncbi:MAG TPA: S1C family serine protease [Candidatus Omnitrophota bacterium]|nr:S1C family serine protease [Candidatus Omnitrophota bacterium]HPS37138.1 S1C family serine protease [Candidatus Omnitrophota bacterium]
MNSQRTAVGCAVLALLLVVSPAPFRAAESSIQTVMETSKALVDIQSVNATVYATKPQGILDKSTGQLLIMRKVRPVSYARSGSGIIIDKSGIIVTAAHTVRGAGGFTVRLFDGTRAKVISVSAAPEGDIAFLRIDPPFPLVPVPWGDSDAVSKGANVFTIGHSEYLNGTVLGGKLSGVGRRNVNGGSHATILQVAFDMRQGDSGCPILDARGALIGMVNAGQTGGGKATFAIASNLIRAAYLDYLKKQLAGSDPGRKSE